MEKLLKSSVFCVFVLLFFAVSSLSGKDPTGTYQNPPKSSTILGTPSATVFNIGNISSWQYNDGRSGHTPGITSPGSSGVIYPRSTAGVVWEDGIIWGGFLTDTLTGGPPPQRLRVGGQTYRIGTTPGRILPGGIGEDPNLPHVRIYRIRRDYLTVSDNDLRLDAAELNQIDPAEVTQEMINAVRVQYSTDWNEWPAQYGAPFYDLNGNGIYEPSLGEEPGLQNADMVIWFVCNDLDSTLTHDLYGSDPIGLELQLTMWGYKHQSARWGQGAIRRYRIINKGGFDIDSMYISQWIDPDVGNYADDLVGCDTVIDLGFAYNGYENDSEYDPFGLAPPAIGYSLLQGPIVPGNASDTALFNFKRIPGSKNLPMTSFGYHGPPGTFGADPNLGVYTGTREWYNLLRGFGTLSDDISNPTPLIVGSGPNMGDTTKFPLSGDPVNDPTGVSGDIDGQGWNGAPADRRMVICSGPFTMMPGDTQEVVIAMFGGIGDTRLESVTELKENIELMRSWYGKPIQIPKVSHQSNPATGTSTELMVQANLLEFGTVTECVASFNPVSGSQSSLKLKLFDDGIHNDSLANDGIWGNSLTVNNRKYPYNGDLRVNAISGRHDFPNIFSKISLRPLPQLTNWRVIWENGQQDSSFNYGELVHLAFDISNLDSLNDINGMKIVNLGPAAHSQTIFYNNVIPPGGTVDADSLFLEVLGSSQGDSTTFSYAISFDGHREVVSSSYPLVAWNPDPVWGDTLAVQSIVGVTNNVFPIVADPLLLNGDTYRLSFFEDTSNGDVLWSLIDYTSGSVILDSLQAAPSPNYPHPVVDGIVWQVFYADSDFVDFQTVANGAGVLDPPEGAAADWQGFPGIGPPTNNQQVGPGKWLIHAGGASSPLYAAFLSRVLRNDNIDRVVPFDYEMRFTAAGGIANWYYTTENFAPVPFELWNIGIGTPDDPSDDYRMIPLVLDEGDDNDVYDLGAQNGAGLDHDVSDGDDDPYLDWVYWWNPVNTSPGTAGYDDFVANGLAALGDEVMGRTVLVNWDGGDVNDPTFPANVNQLMPEEGTIFRILTTKPNFPGDTLVVIAPPPLGIIDTEIPLTFHLDQNYPNPFNPVTRIRFGLAQKEKVKLVIYNVLGQQVKQLINGDMAPGEHVVDWVGRNEAGNKVGTGIYFYRLQAGKFVRSRKMVLLK